MALALVDTKLFLPRPRPGLVRRPRLDGLLGGDRTRLTVLSAPAGFGKTTLLSAWLAGRPGEDDRRRLAAWVSLDEGDRRADVFWTYVFTALDRAAPGTGTAGLGLLATGQQHEQALTAVLNELSVLPDDVDIVLDDYHLADGPEVQAGMALLLERLPPQVRLIISTRADPALPLARLRAGGDLTEVRAADLRFTHEEAMAYLTDAAGLELGSADVAVLESRTEGWIASLQLAAISLRDRSDPSAFIAGFAGDDRYVLDYLVEEVLGRQTAEIRDFLLATAILERLTGPLCDAVTGNPGGAQMLETLDRRNLFVVRLDDRRRWYRYHHLFADVLRAHLLAEPPDHVAELHRRASRWYDDAGEPALAVRHALAAGDVDRAADLVELAVPALRRERREAVIRGWVDALPADILRNRPVLAIGLVGGLMASNDFDDIERRLDDIERQLALPEDELVIVDRDELSRVPAALETYRAALALTAGDPAGTIAHASNALDRGDPSDHLTTSAASALSALASWATGDLDAAHRGYTTAAGELAAIGHVSDVLGCSITLADIATTQGRLRDARRTLEDALRLAERERPGLRGTADMHAGLSEIARAQDDLATAAWHVRRSEELGDDAGLPQNPYRWRVASAGLRQAAGDLSGARSLLEDAVRVYVGDFSPDVRPVPARLARVQAAQGDLDAAWDWARRRGLTPTDEATYLGEYEQVTLARILLEQHRTDGSESALHEAMDLLDRLLAAAEAGGRTGTVIEILALQTLARHAAGDRVAASAALERALTLAEPDGWVRVFTGEPAPMSELLGALAARRPDWAFLRTVATRPTEPDRTTTPPSGGNRTLADPLSERELDVLRLLASDLDGPLIARQLVVSLNTVRTHTKHIYAKLGVNNRRTAVRTARRLGLLTGAGTP